MAASFFLLFSSLEILRFSEARLFHRNRVKGLVLMALAVGALGGAGVGVFSYFDKSYKSASSRQEAFFLAITSGDVENIYAMCHPAMRDHFDPPILDAWSKTVSRVLGTLQRSEIKSITTSTSKKGEEVEVKGVAICDRGVAESELTIVDNQITRFAVDIPEFESHWNLETVSIDSYRERGEKFLQFMFRSNSTSAFDMMTPELQSNVPLEKFQDTCKQISDACGKLDSIAYESHRWRHGDMEILTLTYTVSCELTKVVAKIDFQFSELKGWLVAYRFKGSESAVNGDR